MRTQIYLIGRCVHVHQLQSFFSVLPCMSIPVPDVELCDEAREALVDSETAAVGVLLLAQYKNSLNHTNVC